LNLITHLLGSVPYKKLPTENIKLPARQQRGDYVEVNWTSKHIPQKF
jgi:hypothetical protein